MQKQIQNGAKPTCLTQNFQVNAYKSDAFLWNVYFLWEQKWKSKKNALFNMQIQYFCSVIANQKEVFLIHIFLPFLQKVRSLQKAEGSEKLNSDLFSKFHPNRLVFIYSSFHSLWAKQQKCSLWHVFFFLIIFLKKR